MSFTTRINLANITPSFLASMEAIPHAMKAVKFSRLGGPEVLEYVTNEPVPSFGPGQLLVRNEYCGLNYIDTYFRSGVYKAPLPIITGREGAGTVAAVGDEASGIKVGDRVAYMLPGAAAEYTTVPADKIVVIPKDITSDVAAAATLQALTALTFIEEAGQVKSGQWVLVHAAAGGVGLLLVQLLRDIGAKVIAAASTDEKLALAREHGAEYTVKSGDAEFSAKIKEITEGHGVDVIFDGVGKATFETDLEIVARKGSVVCFGNASGVVPPLDLLRLSSKNVKVMRPVVNNYLVEPEELRYYSTKLFELLRTGKLKINIHKTYSLKDVAQAHIDLAGRGTTGKLLIKID